VSKDIGIDLGTATVLVYVKGRGIVPKEPSVVARDRNTDSILKVGREAQEMLGRTPGNIVAIRPLRDGVISQYEVTLRMIQYFMKKACGPLLFKPRVVICVPSGINEVEERAVIDAGINAGARRTYLIEEPVAAALGAGIDISGPNGHMVVDIGGGTTDIAVLSLGGVVVSESIKVAGDKFDESIIRYMRNAHRMLIGERTAEQIKIRIGEAWPRDQERVLNVKGRCLIEGLPKKVDISSREITTAMEEPLMAVIDAIKSVIERTPPELIDDIISNGIVMTGGGSMLFGINRLVQYYTGIRVRIPKNPMDCVALGTGRSLANISKLPTSIISNRF
jgi:rod shape-determining protein MreB